MFAVGQNLSLSREELFLTTQPHGTFVVNESLELLVECRWETIQ
jgi:hypothetical protein